MDTFCQELNFETIRSQYQVKSVQTVKNYVSFLEQAFLVRILHKYSYKSVERQTGQKSYVVDNSFISNRENALQPQNLGWRLENAIAIELLRRQKYADEQLYYLKDNNRFEVDFVLTERNLVTELIQVTYDFSNPTTKQYNREIGGLIKASAQTHCDNLTLIMMYGEAGERIIDGKIIHCKLAMDWLLRQ